MEFKLKVKLTEKENDRVIYFINDFGKGNTFKLYPEGEKYFIKGVGKNNGYGPNAYLREDVLNYIKKGDFVRITYNEKHNTYTLWQ